MDNFTTIWERIAALAGSEFRQKTGRQFTFSIVGNAVAPITTNRLLARCQFQQAYQRLPLRGPGQLQDLQGPSYLFAILTDPGVTTGSSEMLVPILTPARATSRPTPALEPPRRPKRSSLQTSLPSLADQDAGATVGATDMDTIGFRPLQLHISQREVQLDGVVGCEWITVGDVPDAGGSTPSPCIGKTPTCSESSTWA
ncbi:MAG TPA: hypothetical protein DEV93_00860 [Chloroflexi bacterium]|jgi:hypothetical protein|nr:hypothetical protein [Chloroflexota bacterium]